MADPVTDERSSSARNAARSASAAPPSLVITDGGRAETGFTGEAGDCVTRAIAVALDLPYRDVYGSSAPGRWSLRTRGGSERTGPLLPPLTRIATDSRNRWRQRGRG